MSLEVVEAFGSGSLTTGSSRQGERTFVIHNVEATTTEQAIAEAVQNSAPTEFEGMPLRSVQVEQLTPSVWTGTVTYSPSERLPPAEYDGYLTTFQTGGSTENVQFAYSQTGYSLIDGVQPPDFGTMVGVDSSGSPQGVDIVVPKFEWSETHYLSAATIPGTSNAWLALIHNATGKTNLDSFRGFAPGSVLFLGCSGSKRPEEGDWEVTFQFSAAPGATINLPLYLPDGTRSTDTEGNGESVSITKGGHEYIWFFTRSTEDQQSQAAVTRADAVFVATVYQRVRFVSNETSTGFMPQ